MGMFGSKKTLTPEQREAAYRKWSTIGATMQDVGASLGGGQGGALGRSQAMFADRAAQAKKEAAQAELDAFFGQNMPPGLIGGSAPRRMGPEMDMGLEKDDADAASLIPGLGSGMTLDLQSAMPALMRAKGKGLDVSGYADLIAAGTPQPQMFNTSRGIVSVDRRTGQARTLFSEAPDAPSAPSGYRWEGDKLTYIPGGPADPNQARGLSSARRAPPRARAGGGGAPASSPAPYSNQAIKWD